MISVRVCAAVIVAVLAIPSVAIADESSQGGGAMVREPKVKQLVCDDGRKFVCGRRQSLAIDGEWLSTVRKVTFHGRKGKTDDKVVSVMSTNEHTVVVLVPQSARSGRVSLNVGAGVAPGGRIRVTKPSRASAKSGDTMFIGGRPMRFEYTASPGSSVQLVRLPGQDPVSSWPAITGGSGGGKIVWNGRLDSRDAPVGRYGFRIVNPDGAAGAVMNAFSVYDHIFPIRGKHDRGQGAINNFGGGRGHQGQDMFAACGTPLVAARGGLVIKATFQSRAGNYVVVKRADGQSYAYMHMQKRPMVREGQQISTGQQIGMVGESGRASGCHLHFELWSSPGWYLGGKPVNPLPLLEQWDAWS